MKMKNLVADAPLAPVKPQKRVRLDDHDPDDTGGMTEKRAKKEMADDLERLAKLQEHLYAENRRSLLVVLQGTDTSGKDGTVKHVFSGVNPAGCEVSNFKQPSEEERDHDFLWRIHKQVPRRGHIGIFNRSHYEDVVVVRVHDIIDKAECKRRYKRINAFERELTDGGAVVLKFFLHISKAEQKERLQARLDDPEKHWKFDTRDIEERGRWDAHQAAYEEALAACSTKYAPFFIVPANRKWYRNFIVARTLVSVLERMDPRPVKSTLDVGKIRIPD